MDLLSAKELAGGTAVLLVTLSAATPAAGGSAAALTRRDRRMPSSERQGYDLLDAGDGPQGIKLDMEGPEAAGGDAAGQLSCG